MHTSMNISMPSSHTCCRYIAAADIPSHPHQRRTLTTILGSSRPSILYSECQYQHECSTSPHTQQHVCACMYAPIHVADGTCKEVGGERVAGAEGVGSGQRGWYVCVCVCVCVLCVLQMLTHVHARSRMTAYASVMPCSHMTRTSTSIDMITHITRARDLQLLSVRKAGCICFPTITHHQAHACHTSASTC